MSEPIRQATTSSFPIQDPELAQKLAEMEALIQRIPGMPAPIKKSAASCYADSPFVDDIALVEMPKKFNFPNMKMFDGCNASTKQNGVNSTMTTVTERMSALP